MNMVQLQRVRRGLRGLMTSPNGLNLDDIQWLMQKGNEKYYSTSEHVISRGEFADGMYLVITGQLGVQVSGKRFIARLGPGTVVGDVSYLTCSPESTASVVAIENSTLLHLTPAILEAASTLRTGFANRLLTSLAINNAERLKETSLKLDMELMAKESQEYLLEGPNSEAIRDFLTEIDGFTTSLLKVKDTEKLPVEGSFMQILKEMNVLLGSMSKLSEYRRTWLGGLVQKKLLPFIHMTTIAKRCYTKPRGYAGDYLTTHMIYDNKPDGINKIGRYMDRLFMMTPPLVAARNRREFLTSQISKAFTHEKEFHITSFASGPATEVFDTWDCLGKPNNFYASLVDIDQQAIDYVSSRLAETNLLHQVKPFKENLVSLVLGRRSLDLPPQDLIYCVGLIEYYNDEFVVKLLNLSFQMLRPGGFVIFGNAHISNSCQAFLEYVLEWQLKHRDESDMNRLMASSSFSRPCDEILFENTGAEMFAICRKPNISAL